MTWSPDDRLPDPWVEYAGEPDEPEMECPVGLINLIVAGLADQKLGTP